MTSAAKDDMTPKTIVDVITEISAEQFAQRLARHLKSEAVVARYEALFVKWRDVVTTLVLVENAMYFYAYESCRCAENYYWHYSTFFIVSHIALFSVFLYICLNWIVAKIRS
nr:hypothetical protein [Sicyoidochytrium minutum DNA virus]